MTQRFWQSNAIPWVLLAVVMGCYVALPYAYAQPPSTVNPDDGVTIRVDVAALLGLLTTAAGVALGYGMALQKLKAHCEDRHIHFTLSEAGKTFMPRTEIELLAENIVQRVVLQCREGMSSAPN